MIYLDNAATTFPKPNCVYETLDRANRELAFNSGRGVYEESKKALEAIAEAREKVGNIVGKNKDSVIFTSSATEALNQIIYGLPLEPGDTIFVTPFEHNAVIRPLNILKKNKGINIEIIPFNKDTWDLNENEFYNKVVMKKTKAVIVSQISNVTGFVLPYNKIFEIASNNGAITILDASQGFGILNIETNNTDYIVFAGHKSLYSAFGVGGFVIIHEDKLNPVKAGGTGSDSLNPNMADFGPNKFEAGSHNVVAIAGLVAAIDWIKKTNIYDKEKELTIYFLDKLTPLNHIHVYKPLEQDIFGIISLSVDNYSPEDVGTILYDEYSIAVRTGYHCAPFVHDFIGSSLLSGTVRISFGAFTSKEEIDVLIEALASLDN